VAWKPLDPTLVRVAWGVATRFDTAVLPTPGGPADTVAYLAAAAGERLPRMRELVERYALEAAEGLAWAGQATPPTVLQRNPLRCDETRFRSVLSARYGDAVRFGDGCAFLSPAENPVDNAVFADGGAWVQDATARASADLLGVQPGERVLDLCAAPGGKSVALAVAMQDRGEIVACDSSARRLRSLTQNLARMDLYSVRAVEIPDEAPGRKAGQAAEAPSAAVIAAANAALGRPFDAVLLDVPCSNSGVIARRPEARRSLTAARLKRLVDLQRRLLLKGAGCCRVGGRLGRLVYSTCSIEPEENQEQTAWLRSAQDRWRVEREVLTLPRWGAEISDWRDGGYAVLLVRTH
jgi:16S rRNA (cytosine967-C5)-methyltransferase